MNLAAVRFRDFRIYLIGNIFALNGLWMQRLTIGWIAWELTESASFVGLVAFINFAPTIFAGPFFGVLVDRIRIRRAALITQSVLFVLAIMLFVSFSAGLLGVALLAIVSGVLGTVMAAHNPIRMSLAPRLVDRSAIASVISLTAINFNLARLSGPALAGWLITSCGVGASLLIQALFYLPFILALSILRPRERTRTKERAAPFFQDMAVGVRHVLRTPLIRQALFVTGVSAFISRGVLEILPVVAGGAFDKGATGLGLLTAAAGLGALIAGISKALLPGQTSGQLPSIALVSAVVGTALVPAIGFSGFWPLTLLLVACLGFAATMTGVSMQTAIQVDLEDDLRGRVMSLWVLVGIGSAASGAVFLGALTDLTGIAAALSWAGGFGVLFLAIYIRRNWKP
ncbi:MFS transporter [Sulfitobacter sp. JBTF-M27]|uniref:MFS transporter n=1 Tax=Sulfitobacter sediminilitoris TaxID=2698830 RepID=A0A6P0CJ72_9RHOB|nr:MFS transporter [Sulfitobacter sediminilitoris]NEK24504.1 MFS transporter [Sulfitobacter sediminilitoris]